MTPVAYSPEPPTSAGTCPGNSAADLGYRISDSGFSGNRQRYQLRQEAIDGRSRYSPVITLQQGAAPVMTVYPNRARNNREVRIVSAKEGPVVITLLDAMGTTTATRN